MTDMWAYWLLFLVPAGIAFSPIKGDKLVQHMMWIIVGLLSVLVIGLRYKVGGDWIPYLIYLQNARAGDLETVFLSFTNAVSNGSLYVFLNWVAVQLGLGIYFVNLVCAAITMVGLIKYCQKQPMIPRGYSLYGLSCCYGLYPSSRSIGLSSLGPFHFTDRQ